MLSALLIALREGLEAALVVGIVLVYLKRTGRTALARYVWGGVIAAVVSSLGVGLALQRWKISEDGFEGLLLLLAAVFVVTMILWMNKIARHLRRDIEQKVEAYASRSAFGAGLGLGAFVYLMVVREGAELALILRAVELSTEGLETWIGTALGLALAVAVGVFFFQGTLKISLGRFFSATSIILIIVAIQLAITGMHELSESMWISSSRFEMTWIGPIVRNDVFFFVVVLGAAALLILREWLNARKTPAAAGTLNDAQRRRLAYEQRRQRRWMVGATAVFLVVILVLAADFVYARVAEAQPDAQLVQAADGQVHIPIAQVNDSNMHLFRVAVNGDEIRFLVIKKPGGWGTALDACRICGRAGYRQEGSNVVCRNCASAIYIPSIGEAGGCNPVGVTSRVEGSDIVIDVPSLSSALAEVPQ